MIIIYYLLVFFEIVLVARVLLSWFPNVDRSHPIIQFVFDITEPVLRPIRDLLPQGMMLDLSPLIVILILNVLMQVLF